MSEPPRRRRGRGAAVDPVNRFESRHIEVEAEYAQQERGDTEVIVDHSRTILSRNQSPDLPFDVSLNPYRGCEHGCAYCYARPSHEFLGFSAGLDFERRIVIKPEAAQLLRTELARKSYRPSLMAISGVTDAYQPLERRLGLTRSCLEVLAEARHPVQIVTKNKLVCRDIDLLAELARHQAVAVAISITTLDAELARDLEPRTSTPRARLAAIEELAAAGIPVGVFVAPVIPGLTDHELPAICEAVANSGGSFATWLALRLPGAVAELFEAWLEVFRPAAKDKVLGRIRQIRGGALDDSRFGTRFRGRGPYSEHLKALADVARKRSGLASSPPEFNCDAFRRPNLDGQLDLFE